MAINRLWLRDSCTTQLLDMLPDTIWFTSMTASQPVPFGCLLPTAASLNCADFDLYYFWAWTDFISYIDFLIVFHVACGIVMYLFIDVPLFVELVGFLAVLFEAMLGVPQLKKNYQNKSTLGMSVQMVLMWTTGDIFKTVYFLVRQAPPQFWICGFLQILIDIGILTQVYWYRNSSGVRAKKQDMPD